MSTAKVILLQPIREFRNAQKSENSYRDWVNRLEKVELLEEMMRFQEERSKEGPLSLKTIVQGQLLFAVLEEKAETEELRHLAKSFRRHLECELRESLSS